MLCQSSFAGDRRAGFLPWMKGLELVALEELMIYKKDYVNSRRVCTDDTVDKNVLRDYGQIRDAW